MNKDAAGEYLFSYYGDDFTGSTDALEALAGNGVPTVLFVRPPDERGLEAFPGCRAIGIAGESRSRSPEWMSANLPAIFQRLKSYGAPITQYKVCSTFDSSPETGSIGRALEIGQETFGESWVPILVAAPHLGRYVLFGNLFAAAAGQIYRIDRHPTMSRHPVTPMKESDLRVHLSQQLSSGSIGLVDILAMQSDDPEGALEAVVQTHPRGILFDGLGATALETTGRLLLTRRPAARTFTIGSSGLTHALIRYWRKAGLIEADYAPVPMRGTDRLLVLSGSCSPVTEGQIRRAVANGFEGLRVGDAGPGLEAMVKQADSRLSGGHSVVIYTALGPQDCGGGVRGEQLGCYLGEMLRDLVLRTGVRRVVIAGGDTSTHAVRQLGIEALTFAAMSTPGAPLCRCHAGSPGLDGLEIVLKGGQVGPENYFEMVLRGKS